MPQEFIEQLGGKIALWLDCDPGHDDAIAIILAGHDPRVHLLGISTVAGNQTVEKVTDNALRVLALSGLFHIEVVAGQAKPLLHPRPLLCPEIHGDSGLDGPAGGALLPPCTLHSLPGKAVCVMFDRISAQYQSSGGRRRVQLVCTGALTNAALLLTLYPEVCDMVDIVVMGGCLGIGNTGPVMEFNIQTDPEAAKVVFEAGAPVTMIPLEVTHTALVTAAVLQHITGAEGSTGAASPFMALIRELLLFFAVTYKEVFGFEAPPLHDPCAVAYVIAPHLFQVERMRVDIETCSPLSAGQTVCDVWHQSGKPKNATVAKAMDGKGFWDLVQQALDFANGASKAVRLVEPASTIVGSGQG